MTHAIARIVSIVGHPAPLMATAAVVASSGGDALPPLALALACGVAVIAYGAYKARRGDWGHIDASAPGERAQLNTRVGTGLVAAAGGLALTSLHIGIPVVVALSGLVVLTGHLLQRLAKLSLHVAFAVFAALIAWPQHVAAAILLVIALAVGWSRIVLRRHVGRDLLLGAIVGALAGLAFQAFRSWIDR